MVPHSDLCLPWFVYTPLVVLKLKRFLQLFAALAEYTCVYWLPILLFFLEWLIIYPWKIILNFLAFCLIFLQIFLIPLKFEFCCLFYISQVLGYCSRGDKSVTLVNIAAWTCEMFLELKSAISIKGHWVKNEIFELMGQNRK